MSQQHNPTIGNGFGDDYYLLRSYKSLKNPPLKAVICGESMSFIKNTLHMSMDGNSNISKIINPWTLMVTLFKSIVLSQIQFCVSIHPVQSGALLLQRPTIVFEFSYYLNLSASGQVKSVNDIVLRISYSSSDAKPQWFHKQCP